METVINIGDIFIDCGYHPVKCTHIDPEEDELEGISLISKMIRRCSIIHCAPKKINIQEAQVLCDIHKKEGEPGLMKKHGWQQKDIDDFMKNWR